MHEDNLRRWNAARSLACGFLALLFLGTPALAQGTVRILAANGQGRMRIDDNGWIYFEGRDDPATEWILERVSGTEFYRIRSRPTGHYLHAANGEVRVSPADPGSHAAMWRIIDSHLGKGETWYRIQNRSNAMFIGSSSGLASFSDRILASSPDCPECANVEILLLVRDLDNRPFDLRPAEARQAETDERARAEAYQRRLQAEGCWLASPQPGSPDEQWFYLRATQEGFRVYDLDSPSPRHDVMTYRQWRAGTSEDYKLEGARYVVVATVQSFWFRLDGSDRGQGHFLYGDRQLYKLPLPANFPRFGSNLGKPIGRPDLQDCLRISSSLDP